MLGPEPPIGVSWLVVVCSQVYFVVLPDLGCHDLLEAIVFVIEVEEAMSLQ